MSLKSRPIGPRLLVLVLVLAVGLAGLLAWAAPPSGKAPLDNDPDDDREAYQGLDDRAPGYVDTDARAGDDGFDRLEFGMSGGGTLFGWRDLDGDDREVELVVSDPTLTADDVRLADADDDGDIEVAWVGTRGADIDGNGEVILEESGTVIGLTDIDGDGNAEIIVQDTSRSLGAFHHDAFGINRAESDPMEVLWVGVLSESQHGRAATVIGLNDVDADGESEVELQDIRTSGSPPFDQYIDVDNDGDGDIVVRIPDGSAD